jgi:hypothetical protein
VVVVAAVVEVVVVSSSSSTVEVVVPVVEVPVVEVPVVEVPVVEVGTGAVVVAGVLVMSRISEGVPVKDPPSRVKSRLVRSDMSTGVSSMTRGGAMAMLATCIKSTHAVVATASASARRIIPTPGLPWLSSRQPISLGRQSP